MEGNMQFLGFLPKVLLIFFVLITIKSEKM